MRKVGHISHICVEAISSLLNKTGNFSVLYKVVITFDSLHERNPGLCMIIQMEALVPAIFYGFHEGNLKKLFSKFKLSCNE